MIKAQYIASRAGRRKLTHEGFAYIHNVTSPSGKRLYWKCEHFRRNCQARAVTDSDENLVSTSEHNHDSYAEEIERRKMEGSPKYLAKQHLAMKSSPKKQQARKDTADDTASIKKRKRTKKITIIKAEETTTESENTQESDKENCSATETDASPKFSKGKKIAESDGEESGVEQIKGTPRKQRAETDKTTGKKRNKPIKKESKPRKKKKADDVYACETESSQEEDSDRQKRKRKPTKKGEEFEKIVKEKAQKKAKKLQDNTDDSQEGKKNRKHKNNKENGKEARGKRMKTKEKQDDNDSDEEVQFNHKHKERKAKKEKFSKRSTASQPAQADFMSKYFKRASDIKKEQQSSQIFTHIREKKKDSKNKTAEEKFDSLFDNEEETADESNAAGDKENKLNLNSGENEGSRQSKLAGGGEHDKHANKSLANDESVEIDPEEADFKLFLEESPVPRKSPRKNLGMKEKDPEFIHGKEASNMKAATSAESSPSGSSSAKRSKLSLTKRSVKEGSPAVQKLNFNAPKEADPAPGKPCMPVKSEEKSVVKQEEKSVVKAPKDKSNGIASFENLGNSCYLNSVLQVLRHTPGLTEKISLLAEEIHNTQTEWRHQAFSQANENGEVERHCAPAVWRLVKTLRDLFVRMNNLESLYQRGTISGLTIKPEKLMEVVCKVNPMFDGNLQQDAHELLMCILCWIQDATKELNKYRKQQRNLPKPLTVSTKDEGSTASNNQTGSSPGTVKGPLDKYFSPRSKAVASQDGSGLNRSQESPQSATVAKSPSCGTVQANMEATQASDIASSLQDAGQFSTFTEVPEASKTLPILPSCTGNASAESTPTKPGKRKRAHSTSEIELDEKSGLFIERKRQCYDGDSPNKKLKRSPSCSALDGPSVDKTGAGSVRRNLMATDAGLSSQESANNTLKALLTADLAPGPAGDGSKSSQCRVNIPPNSPVKLTDFKSRAAVKLERDGIRKYFVAQDKKTKSASELERSTKVIPDVVESLFQGTLAQQTKCLECEHTTERKEAFHDISVAVRKDRKKLLAAGDAISDDEEEKDDLKWLRSAFSEVERLQGENKYFCDKCAHLVEAERSQRYKGMPEILTLHLKRFAHTQNGFFCKINDHIPTPMVLPCLRKGCPSPCLQTSHKYELYAVITHVGISLSAGHYTAYVKVPHRRHEESGSSTLVGMNVLSQKFQHNSFSIKGHNNNGRQSTNSTPAPYNGATKQKDGNSTVCVQESTGQQSNATTSAATTSEAADPNNNADANNNLSAAEQQPSTSSTAAHTPVAGTSQNSTDNRLIPADRMKTRSSSRWIECDDDVITLLSEEKFRRMLSPSSSGTPYILMYRRCSD